MNPLHLSPAPDDESPRRQVGALVWRMEKGVLEVLLVTSRETGRFVIPKGWPMKGLSDWKAAEREVFEEAGITGRIGYGLIGQYSYMKILGPGFALPCTVDVYPMQAGKELSKWPEKSERVRHWMTVAKAAAAVNEPDLSELIADFIPVL